MNPIGHFRFSEHYLNREYDLSVWSAFLTKSVQCHVLIFGLLRWKYTILNMTIVLRYIWQ